MQDDDARPPGGPSTSRSVGPAPPPDLSRAATETLPAPAVGPAPTPKADAATRAEAPTVVGAPAVEPTRIDRSAPDAAPRTPSYGPLAPPQPNAAPLVPGMVLEGRYRLISKIGEGGMGDVWKAEHLAIKKHVAVKILSLTDADDELSERFLREARAAAAVKHKNVVDITDFGTTESKAPFFVMELLEGKNLRQVVRKEGALSWERAQPILADVAGALHAAHERGIIHRDVKPSNIFLADGDTETKVIDFGIAKDTELSGEARKLTRTGFIQGTPSYMSPEQCRGEQVDVRSDVYAMGCVAYFALTGFEPFSGKDLKELLQQQLFIDPVPPRSRDQTIPADAEAVVLRALAKSPDARFQTMAEFRAAVLEVVSTDAPAGTPAPAEPAPEGKPAEAMVAPATRSGMEPTIVTASEPVGATRRPLWPWALAGAAVLVVGIVLSSGTDTEPTDAAASDPEVPAPAAAPVPEAAPTVSAPPPTTAVPSTDPEPPVEPPATVGERRPPRQRPRAETTEPSEPKPPPSPRPQGERPDMRDPFERDPSARDPEPAPSQPEDAPSASPGAAPEPAPKSEPESKAEPEPEPKSEPEPENTAERDPEGKKPPGKKKDKKKKKKDGPNGRGKKDKNKKRPKDRELEDPFSPG